MAIGNGLLIRCFTNGFHNCRRFQRRFSTTNGDKNFFIWKCKILAGFLGIVSSIYGTVVFVSSDYNLRKAKRIVCMHVNGLFYGYQLLPRHQVLINSQFNVCISNELKEQVAKYFINLDQLKENGVRRSDVLELLDALKINVTNPAVEAFTQRGVGETKELRKYSGCTLQEFAELVEYLILEQRIKSNDDFESQLVAQLEEINRNLDKVHIHLNPQATFRLGSPYVSDAAKELGKELSKYMPTAQDVEIVELEAELRRNDLIKAKLEQKQKAQQLSTSEKRRLDSIYREIQYIEDELEKHKHKNNLLHFK